MTIAGCALAGVMTVGVLVSRVASGSSPEPASSPALAQPAVDEVNAVDSATRAGGTVAVTKLDGARLAAIAVVARTGEVVAAGFISRRELIESFTTPEFGHVLVDETSRAVNAMLIELGSRDLDSSQLMVREQPITAAVSAVGDRAQVHVWSVLIVAAPGTGPGRQVWRTVKLEMVDRDGVWLVDGWTSLPGPTPAAPAEGVVDAAEVIAVPLGWEPVGVG
ncbi:MAG: hypothetical protein ABI862_14040 [Ilumatobacteraceae bacterium]